MPSFLPYWGITLETMFFDLTEFNTIKKTQVLKLEIVLDVVKEFYVKFV